MPAGYPRTREKIARLGYRVIEVDTSEYRKIDGGRRRVGPPRHGSEAQ